MSWDESAAIGCVLVSRYPEDEGKAIVFKENAIPEAEKTTYIQT